MEILTGTTLTVVLVVVAAILGLAVGKFNLKSKIPAIDEILKFAQVAVEAVEKLSDNGAYAGLSKEERHVRKKADAMRFVEEALSVQFGISMTPVLRYVIDMAIEATLKRLERTA